MHVEPRQLDIGSLLTNYSVPAAESELTAVLLAPHRRDLIIEVELGWELNHLRWLQVVLGEPLAFDRLEWKVIYLAVHAFNEKIVHLALYSNPNLNLVGLASNVIILNQ